MAAGIDTVSPDAIAAEPQSSTDRSDPSSDERAHRSAAERMHPVTLRFAAALEREFLRSE